MKKLGDYVERYKIETRDWRIGDMVKVIGYDITGLPTHTYGIIMSPGDEEQQRIFLDRVRLPQTSARTSGFGVGLSVCRRIVEVHGGKIWVVSEPGKGACFYFTVPVWDGQEKDQKVLTEGVAGP